MAEEPDLRAGSAAHGARNAPEQAARAQQEARRTARQIAHASVPGATPEESGAGSAVAVANLAFAGAVTRFEQAGYRPAAGRGLSPGKGGMMPPGIFAA